VSFSSSRRRSLSPLGVVRSLHCSGPWAAAAACKPPPIRKRTWRPSLPASQPAGSDAAQSWNGHGSQRRKPRDGANRNNNRANEKKENKAKRTGAATTPPLPTHLLPGCLLPPLRLRSFLSSPTPVSHRTGPQAGQGSYLTSLQPGNPPTPTDGTPPRVRHAVPSRPRSFPSLKPIESTDARPDTPAPLSPPRRARAEASLAISRPRHPIASLPPDLPPPPPPACSQPQVQEDATSIRRREAGAPAPRQAPSPDPIARRLGSIWYIPFRSSGLVSAHTHVCWTKGCY
jgi:hypothetical protein